MKDLIFITAHCTESEQIESLERCVNSLIDSKYHIAIISHTHIPSYIQKKCHYYFYDYLNEISENHEMIGSMDYNFLNGKILRSLFFHKYFYGFAIYRMFSIASNIAKVFGYKNIHQIEYDCQLLDIELIDKHSKLLENYDSVCYTTNGELDGRFFGSFKSFKVESLPTLFTNYNRDIMENFISNSNVKALEFFTKNLLNDNGKVCFLKEEELTEEKFIRGKNFYNRNLHYTLFYDEKNNSVNIFYLCVKPDGEKITVMVNDDKVINFELSKNHWGIQTLGDLGEVDNVRVDNGVNIIYKKTLDFMFKEKLKTHSFIIDEKDS